MLAPLVLAHAAVQRANPHLESQTPWATALTTVAEFPWGLFGWLPPASLAPPPPLAVPGLALVVIACGVASLGLRRGDGDPITLRGWQHAGLWTLIGIVLGMPAKLKVFGTIVPLPYGWLWSALPSLRVIRVPARLGVAGLMGLCLLTALAFDEIVRRLFRHRRQDRVTSIARSGAAAAMVLTLVAPAASRRAYPLLPMPASAPYAALLRESRAPLLEISYAPSQGRLKQVGAESAAIFRSIGIWRPLLNGYGSYWPREYTETQRLTARLPEDAGALDILREKTGVESILVWPRQLPPEKRAAWEAVAGGRDPSLALIASGEQDALLFRVEGRHTDP
jgi:hypothetical protein